MWGWFKENILSSKVYKIKFVKWIDTENLMRVGSVYFNPTDNMVSFKGHSFPVDVRDCVFREGNSMIQYRDFENMSVIKTYDAKAWVKPNGRLLKAEELAASLAAAVAKAVAVGGQLQASMLLLILVAAAGVMGGVLIGYFGLPAALGSHVVPLPTATPIPVG